MKKQKFKKGSPLFALARSKAKQLDIDSQNKKMTERIHAVQLKEGHQDCFRKLETCGEMDCCWQLSCGAKMKSD
ncbi:MAG: hypothetical protein HKP44_08520 [Desulfofustis sp.]|nr:hypothetical protein [Desulfofustis sp.]